MGGGKKAQCTQGSLNAMIQLCSQQTKCTNHRKYRYNIISLLRYDGKSAVVVKDINLGKQTKHYSE